MLRAYGDRALLRRFAARFVLAPVLLASACIYASHDRTHVVVLAAFAWGVWHGMAQTYGFARIYAAKGGAGDRPSARADRALVVSWFATAIVCSPLRLYFLLDVGVTCGLGLPSAQAIAALKIALVGATALATLWWMVVVIRGARAGRGPGWVRLLTLVTSIGFWWFANVRVRHLLLGLPLFEVFHDAQYLTIVWAFNRRRGEGAGQALGAAARALSRPTALSIGLYLSAVCGYGLALSPPWIALGPTVVGLVAASQLLHFYYDGFIWKVREPETARVLGVTGAATRLPSSGWPAARHGLLWVAFIVPVAWLWHAESSSTLGDDERRIAVAALVPDNYMGQFAAAETEWKSGDRAEALAGFRRALALDPSQARVRKNLALSLADLADEATVAGDAPRARSYLDEIAAMRPLLDDEMRAWSDRRLARPTQAR